MNDTAAHISPELFHLKARVLSLEQQVSQYEKDGNAAQRTADTFRVFLERVEDYAFLSFDKQDSKTKACGAGLVSATAVS